MFWIRFFFFSPPVLSVLCALRLIACAARPTLSNQTGGWKRGKTATQGPSIIGGDLEGGWTLHLVSELVEMATAPSEKKRRRQSPRRSQVAHCEAAMNSMNIIRGAVHLSFGGVVV